MLQDRVSCRFRSLRCPIWSLVASPKGICRMQNEIDLRAARYRGNSVTLTSCIRREVPDLRPDRQLQRAQGGKFALRFEAAFLAYDRQIITS